MISHDFILDMKRVIYSRNHRFSTMICVGVICNFEIESAVRFIRFVGRCCMRKMKSGPWPIHNNADTYKSHQSSYHVELVRRYLVYSPTPQHRHNDENPAICSINSSKVRRLECWDNAVKNEHNGPNNSKPQTFIFS